MASRKRRRRKQKKAFGVLAVIILIIVVVLILLMTAFIKKYTPSKEASDYTEYYGLTTEESMVVVVDDQKADVNGLYINDRAYVDYETVHDYMNQRFFWDGTEQVLRYTLPEELISISPDSSEYTIGKGREDAGYTICTVRDGVMYMAVDFVKEYTDLRYKVYEDPDRIVVSCEWGELSYTKVKKNTEIREKGGIKSPILTSVDKGALVTVLEEGDNWSKVCTEDGFIGYLKNDKLGGDQVVEVESTFEDVTYDKITRDFDINMAWHQVTNQTANGSIESVLATTPGINVISPTWFYMNDDNGGIMNLASADYVTACHAKGIEVWALVSNLENPDVDVAHVLNTTSTRDNLVNQLISAALRYDLDGINVDFEALSGEVGDGFIQFIRELSLKCANNDIVLSIDNYPPSAYTGLYYRSEQARFADYIVLMAYDEHYSGSDAGSVASIGWVRESVEATLEEVPADQVVLGIPLYTRVWKLTPSDESDTGYVVSSEAVGMSEVDTRMAVNNATMQWQEDVGQYYTEYEHEGSTYKIWIEEQNSIEEKMKVFQEYDLAGVSFWKIGFEKANIWDAVADYIN
ncbi:MAG: SH3 domain-containing protein [Eubacterium sp.]|nr:SH3 domain-containing protein [Eubacterium sp.]